MGRSRYKILENDRPHFLTCTVVEWIPLFKDDSLTRIILESLSFLQKQNRLTIYAYVIMKNHLHLVASSEHLSKEIGDFKSFTARSIINALKEKNNWIILNCLQSAKLKHKRDSTYQVWQEGSHPQAIQSPSMMRQKIKYIHANPVRAGYVVDESDWVYSSASNYEGRGGLLQITTDW